jgi:hypothetical protein
MPARTAKACGPDLPTLGSSFPRDVSRGATVAIKPGHRGEHDISRKAIAQGIFQHKNINKINSKGSLCPPLCRDPLGPLFSTNYWKPVQRCALATTRCLVSGAVGSPPFSGLAVSSGNRVSSLASGTITPPFGLCSAGHARTPVSSQRPPSADVRMTPAATHAGVVPFGEIGHARGARTSARFGSGPILGAACFVSRSYEHCGRVIRRSERASATKSIRSLCRWLSRGRSARPARRVADWGMPSAWESAWTA